MRRKRLLAAAGIISLAGMYHASEAGMPGLSNGTLPSSHTSSTDLLLVQGMGQGGSGTSGSGGLVKAHQAARGQAAEWAPRAGPAMAPLVGQGPAVGWGPQAGPAALAVGLDWAVAREAVVARRVPAEAVAVQSRLGAAAVQEVEGKTLGREPNPGHSIIRLAGAVIPFEASHSGEGRKKINQDGT